MMRRVAWLLCLSIAAAAAQQAPAPGPLVRASIDPPTVTVGQATTLHIDVLAPNYMTKPPVVPDIALANAVTRAAATVNLTEQHDGVTFAGVRFELMIFPQEAGAYAVADKRITLTYAADPPATREAVVELPRITFEAVVPDAARTLDPFVAASRLVMRQEIRRSSDALKVGDAVTRTVTTEAEGTPAMLLPPTHFGEIDGLRLYPAQPELNDKSEARTGTLTATRVDQATYMLERPGDFTLPALELAWWNVREQAVARSRVDPVALHVTGVPASVSSPAAPAAQPLWRKLMLFGLDRWRAALLAMVALGALAWALPPAVRGISAALRRRRDAYRRSEAFSFSRLRAAARRGDARRTYAALLDWLPRFAPAAPTHTIGALRQAARDPMLDHEIALIERELFAPQPGPGARAPRRLVTRISAARRRLLRQQRHPEPPGALPDALNPGVESPPPRRRPVAR
jgi:hypothetical protein